VVNLYNKINSGEVYIVAEMSANHGGSLENALEIVRQVAKTGADCLKTQTYNADSLTVDSEKEFFKIRGGLWDGYSLYELYKEASTPYEWQEQIKKECEKHEIDFLSTPFCNKDVDFLEGINIEAYKIASFELVDIPLVEYIASKGKPVIISTGMGSIKEIEEALDACYRVGNNQIVLLKCCSEYPAKWKDMYLRNIVDMKERFNVPVGLSDHSEGSLAPIVATTLGACVIEKHIRLDDVKSVDSDFSMTVTDFEQMVSDVRNTEIICSGPNYSLTSGEKDSVAFRRSIFAVKDIPADEEFSKENIRIIRPGYGMKPKHYNELLGRKAKHNYKRGDPICDEL